VEKCPFCEAELAGNAPRFCASCGSELAEAVGDAEPEPDAGASSSPPEEEVLFDERPAVLGHAAELLLTILTVGIALLFFWLRSLGRHYRITTQRIVIEHGILNKRLEQIELSRVMDFVVERPLGQRMMGTGNLVLSTADRSTPEVRIDGIRADVRALYEDLRAAVEEEKRLRGVRVVDME
jgi:membrane protein YdbS with pleckstrin-like domain